MREKAANRRTDRLKQTSVESKLGDAEQIREKVAAYQTVQRSARQFIEKWARAGPVLEKQRRRDLMALDEDSARRIIVELLAFWKPSPIQRQTSGLVEQQRLFMRYKQVRDEGARNQ